MSERMKYTEIDRQFDDALERARQNVPPVSGPYGSGPLAADHFLLKKSWDYFRNRVRAIEDQWRHMLDAKAAQLNATSQELQSERKMRLELEEETRMLRSLDATIKKARTEDFTGFARKSENLRMRWDAEREVLQRRIDQYELRVAQQKKDLEARKVTFAEREARLIEMIQMLKADAATHADRERDIHCKWGEEIKQKDDKLQSLETKVELLRGEIDRRDQLIKQFELSVAGFEKDKAALVQYVSELQRTLCDRDTEIQNQKTRYEILTRERDALHAGWERERAEWRELWDRGREAWDKRR